MQWKNWDGKKVYTVNAGHVEYIELERFPVTDKILELSKKAKQLLFLNALVRFALFRNALVWFAVQTISQLLCFF
jgi:hypothetical protein